MAIFVVIGAGVLTALVHLAVRGFDVSTVDLLRILLLHQFVVTHGIIAAIGFVTNVLTPERTARQLGWPGGPFQIKYGFSQLGLGVMGALCIVLQGQFWAAMLITMYIYGASGLWTHTLEVRRKHRETGRWDRIEISNMVLDVVYHVVLTVMSLQIPGVWEVGR
ncbi:DUF6790 family protein [Brachybacterium squillarum]|uniref:DUF6790 family protein n=1 Tax=Brachybacterium squillarum TaxID=661979 RepID=UPI00026299AE|nr:DUF6790 family protein [Brachybacterium squillarum]